MPIENPIQPPGYRDLPAEFFEESMPMAPASPQLLALNTALLEQYGIDPDWFNSNEGLAVLSGQGPYTHSPIALAYAAHQFGHWVPLLGDGRAHMLGQLVTADSVAIDVQLKGSGRTRFSRNGDGRATLGSVLREHLVSEAMAGLGIPSTRSLAVISTGEQIMREGFFPGGILVRTAQSHIRVGSFQFAATSQGKEGVTTLADYFIGRHFPNLSGSEDRYLQLLGIVIDRQARLVAQWMLVGFIHGVMNTDNTSIIGETIDYGPCAFMDEFHPNKVFSSIDRNGRYAWSQQPSIALWNLVQLASTFMPLIEGEATEAETQVKTLLDGFAPAFHTAFDRGMRQKLGIGETVDTEDFTAFSERSLGVMTENSIDFTHFFDQLTKAALSGDNSTLQNYFQDAEQGAAWLSEWQKLRSDNPDITQGMRSANPALIARNHRVEEAIEAASNHNDLQPFQRLCTALANPYEVRPEDAELQNPPDQEQRVTQTFCGT